MMRVNEKHSEHGNYVPLRKFNLVRGNPFSGFFSIKQATTVKCPFRNKLAALLTLKPEHHGKSRDQKIALKRCCYCQAEPFYY